MAVVCEEEQAACLDGISFLLLRAMVEYGTTPRCGLVCKGYHA
jgi:hypothetical protein